MFGRLCPLGVPVVTMVAMGISSPNLAWSGDLKMGFHFGLGLFGQPEGGNKVGYVCMNRIKMTMCTCIRGGA